jgi:DNA-binding XRE family transcriptional regulator
LFKERGEKMNIQLKMLREKKKLTQAQIAERVGISQQAYSQIENELIKPSLETALKISEVLKTSANKIFSLEKQV